MPLGSSRLYQHHLGLFMLRVILTPFAFKLTKHPRMKTLDSVSNAFYDAGMSTWDIFLTLGNLVRLSRPIGKVVPEGHPGYGGYWPEYRLPQEGDSRSCCPCLNAMANHGMYTLCNECRAI